ncbi:hypothetical protein ColLi_12244 [Colletotrichum liriopes]|uniref:Uncharacterized protein n=1 Tax=Colletotrichum liriopes TaxID=708192 RepID=A0AA37GZX5_9PEZI|nr:hypothetical protein ColLi_12244 [Colletotrichum liriopes]
MGSFTQDAVQLLPLCFGGPLHEDYAADVWSSMASSWNSRACVHASPGPVPALDSGHDSCKGHAEPSGILKWVPRTSGLEQEISHTNPLLGP